RTGRRGLCRLDRLPRRPPCRRPLDRTPGASVTGARPGDGRRRSELVVVALFCVTGLSGLLLLGVYIAGGQTQVEGILLAIALGALGAGIVVWAHDLIPSPIAIEERHPLGSPEAIEGMSADLDPEGSLSRRRLLRGSLPPRPPR